MTAFPLWRAIDNTDETERWILWVCQRLMWPISMDKLNSPVIPGTSCFYGNWVEDVHADQFIIIVTKNEFD